jgi:hypothetical protein
MNDFFGIFMGSPFESLNFAGSWSAESGGELDVLASFRRGNFEFFDFSAAIDGFDGGLARGKGFSWGF